MAYRTLCVFGTRPEAIKMAPVIKQLQAAHSIQNKVCVTGQHKQMLDPILDSFGIRPDYHLEVMAEGQDLSGLTAKILTRLVAVYKDYKPNLVLVHGDTTTTLTASLAAYYHHIAVAHVEAGLRTGNLYSPWPEEVNRKLTGAFHFAPTQLAKNNLLEEGVSPESIYVTGNTVIDALFEIANKLDAEPLLSRYLQQEFHYLNPARKMILVTGHRRESFGQGFERICQALANIARLYPNVDIVYPVHLNPNVQEPVKAILSATPNIYLIDPVDYLPFVYLMKTAYLILTDSGGIQEEAPSLGKPVLVMRDITERPEAIDAGTVKLVGTSCEKIVSCVEQLLANEHLYQTMSHAKNPYGDGKAAIRIARVISRMSGELVNHEHVSTMEEITI